MTTILTLSGSPSSPSRSSAVLAWTRRLLAQEGSRTDALQVRDLPAEAVLHGQFSHPAIQESVARIAAADAVILATPVYKAAYAGILKAFLDLLPQDALAGKVVLPIVTGGSLAHLLVLDYALGPVLSALGARHVLRGVYLPDSQVHWEADGEICLAEEAEERLRSALRELNAEVNHQQSRKAPARTGVGKDEATK